MGVSASRNSKQKPSPVKMLCWNFQSQWEAFSLPPFIKSRRFVPVCETAMLPATFFEHPTNTLLENEPDMLVQAFEADAAHREQEMQNLWGDESPEFKTEDPTRTSSFKGLDRTKILASPDYLINSPIGLEIFLRLAKNRQPSNPMSAVGLSPGPAFMSYGSAVAKYGPPEAPGEDWPSEGQIETAPEILSASNAESAPTSLGSSWELFTENRFLNYTALLVAQYAKLVREQSA